MNIEELSDSSEDEPKRRQCIKWSEEENDRLFTAWTHHSIEYLWKVAKEMPKWHRIIQEESTTKRTKLSNSGAYTSSSNQDTEGETISKEECLEGQKKAKARLKVTGKSAAPTPLSNQPSQNMVMYHEAMSMKAKTARDKKYKTYLKLLAIDTSNFNEKEKKGMTT